MRIGIDLIQIADIDRSIAHFGARFLARVFTPAELDECAESSSNRYATDRLAARFAAKEAVMKVLRPDDAALPWQTIEIRRQPGGWCRIELHREARLLADAAGIGAIEISLTHHAGYAVAAAVAAPL